MPEPSSTTSTSDTFVPDPVTWRLQTALRFLREARIAAHQTQQPAAGCARITLACDAVMDAIDHLTR